LKILAKYRAANWRTIEREWIVKIHSEGHPVMNVQGGR
jgi:hypothetical protein